MVNVRIEKIAKDKIHTEEKFTNWQDKKVFDVCPLQRGFDLPQNKIVSGKYPIVYSNGILSSHKSYKVKGPGVITGRSGTIGKVTFVEGNYWPHNTTLWVTDFKGNVPKFIFYLLQYTSIEKFSSGSGVPTLNRNDIHTVVVKIPSFAEQQKIATALSDMDDLIESLEKIIEKKKKIKQGTMQQLLTGEKRLPGYNSEWSKKTINAIANVRRGETLTSRTLVKGKIPVIAGGKNPAYYHAYSNRSGENITISASGANAGFVNYFNESIFASDCSTVSSKCENISTKYIFYNLKLRQEEIYNLQTGGAQPHIHPSDIAPLIIKLPEYKEQQAIAEILSDMDAEIEALEEKLEKYKRLKEGMMQELLTGRIRLV